MYYAEQIKDLNDTIEGVRIHSEYIAVLFKLKKVMSIFMHVPSYFHPEPCVN